jgi:tetratricopeptide (TPR) repeat protein
VKHDYEGAIALFRTAIELDPESAGAHYNLGCALEGQGKRDEAIINFRKAVKLDPKAANFRRGLAATLARKGWSLVNSPDPKLRDPKQAFALAKEGLELDPKSVNVWQNLGWIQYRTENWKDSIESLEQSCKLQEGGDDAQWIVLALAHARLAIQEGLPEKEREQHKAEALRRYKQANELIDKRSSVRPDKEVHQWIWDFRLEFRKLMGLKEIQE